MPDTAVVRAYILGFDFGLRRIGVAVGQFTTMTATRLETVGHGKTLDWAVIDHLVREWQPALLLVGLPLAINGDETDMSRAARKFGARLHDRYSLDVSFADERLSSRAAQSRFAELRAQGNLKKKHARQLDAMAAQIILESWLQSTPGEFTGKGLRQERIQ
ncbi:MAG: Holliday junction resolvase RuvX [Proteobacteria bacterium]|nr:Holliday junction resolvase RuvX [Pseudomonadota bacterium]